MPGRKFNTPTYRYGFNGKESDFEVHNGQGTSYDYGLRIYDPRLGKFLSVDPISKNYPMLTPYQYASNRPIDGIDWDGLEHRSYLYKEGANGKTTLLSVVDYTETKSGTGPLGAGVEVKIILKNGETKWTFVPDKKAEKTVYQDVMDGPDSFGAYMEEAIRPGEKGLVKFSKDINDVGIALQYTPLAPVGVFLNAASDVIDTGLDIKNGNPNTVENALVKVGTTVAGGLIGKAVDKLPVKDFNKEVIDAAVNQGGELIEDHYTTPAPAPVPSTNSTTQSSTAPEGQ
jgi:RHS repeat-associated protein